MKDMVDCRC